MSALTRSWKGVTVTNAIIGVGNLGSALARNLVAGGEQVVLAARDAAHAETLAKELGPNASAASVEAAIAGADVVVLAIWLDQIKELAPAQASLFDGKVVVDPSNPLGFDENGQMVRTLPADQSAGSIVRDLLPATAHYVKAFGTLGADSLAVGANRAPQRVALFYATDDEIAAATVERLITTAGFEPVKIGGAAAAIRIEMPGGDLHQFGLNGDLLDLDQARNVLAASEVPA
jgi:8-hydroxy-5-deazaflavin:NADPH oxidoreductase